MRTGKRFDGDLTTGSIPRKLLTFSLPIMFGLLLQQLYNTADALIVGRFVNKEALAAVGSTASILNMMIGLMSGLALGASIVISQFFGAHDTKRVSKTAHTAVVVTLISGTVCAGLGLGLVPPLLRLMNTPESIFPQAQRYLSICALGFPALFLYNMGAGILRAVGDSKRPLVFLICSSLVNILLDVALIVACGMGVEGAALATVISQVVSAALVTAVLMRSSGPYRISLTKLRVDGSLLKRILEIGLPAALQQVINSFSNTYVQGYINQFGADCMAGWAVHSKVDMLLLTPMDSVAQASATLVGQNYGAGNLRRIRSGVRWAACLGAGITMALVTVMLLNIHAVAALFNSDGAVVEYSVRIIRLVIPFYPLCCFNVVYASALRGSGFAKISSLMSMLSYTLFRQLYLLAVNGADNAFTWVILVYPMGWVLSCVLHGVFYHGRVLPYLTKTIREGGA